MEFIGNQITWKNVLATLMVAFFIGRISLFGGTFPAAVALITVMVAVSTVYIYLVPVMALGMLTWHLQTAGFSLQGADFYGDMAAVIFCGLFFIFFHNRKFTINQRTSVAAAAVVAFNCAYYAYENILFLLRFENLLMEVLAMIIYIRVFNSIARVLFVGNGAAAPAGAAAAIAGVRAPAGGIAAAAIAGDRTPGNGITAAAPLISGEKLGLALQLAVVSIIGSIGIDLVVFPLWVFVILFVLNCKGLQWGMTTAVIGAVFWQCQFNPAAGYFLPLFTALICGWFLATLVDSKYRKSILTFTVFVTLSLSVGSQIYGIAVITAIFAALPSSYLTKLWCLASAWIAPEPTADFDLRFSAIKADLQKKRETFRGLGQLYGMEKGSRQIVSYQFEGMARAVDEILNDLKHAAEPASTAAPAALRRGVSLPAVSVGGASYAGGKVSGDSSMSFAYGKNKQALIISDGMGKGSKAAAESNMVVTTLSRLLAAGFDVDLAMKTVNAILMTEDSREMFASVDLAIIDRETLRTQIYKMGAASTFVKHEGKVSMLKRPALPVGVTGGVKLEYIDVRLKKGDLLVMVSDGITDCDRHDTDCSWLRQRLTEIGSRNPDTVAELIINKAAEKYGIRERDDLTVMVAAI